MATIKHFLPSDWQGGSGYGDVEDWGGEEVVILDRSGDNPVAVPIRKDVVICDSDRDFNYIPRGKKQRK